jgi:hypothetical protein
MGHGAPHVGALLRVNTIQAIVYARSTVRFRTVRAGTGHERVGVSYNVSNKRVEQFDADGSRRSAGSLVQQILRSRHEPYVVSELRETKQSCLLIIAVVIIPARPPPGDSWG